MTIRYSNDPATIDWQTLREDLIADDFHNGRTDDQLETSFASSQKPVFAMDEDNRCVGTARAFSDGVCNAYVVDVWTHSGYRGKGVASTMMHQIIDACPGQHVYLITDTAVDFYKKLGFREQLTGMHIISGTWLVTGPE